MSPLPFHAAAMLGRRFGIVSFTAALRPMFEDVLDHHAMRPRCAGFRMGPAFGGDPGRVAEERRGLLLDLIRASVEEDGAESVILAGGPLAGLAATLQAQVPVPLVDGTAAAVRLAEALAGLARIPPRGRDRAPDGFAPEVAALYGA